MRHCALPNGSWCFVSLFDVSASESILIFRFHPSSWNIFVSSLWVFSSRFYDSKMEASMVCFLPFIFLLHVLSFFLCMVHVHHMKDTCFHIICIWCFGFLQPFESNRLVSSLCDNNLAQSFWNFKLEYCIKWTTFCRTKRRKLEEITIACWQYLPAFAILNLLGGHRADHFFERSITLWL